MATLRNERRGGPIPRSACDTLPSDNALCAQPGGWDTRAARHAIAMPARRRRPSSPGTAKLPASRRVGPSGCRVRCGAVYKDGPAGSSHARASRTVPGRLRGYVGRRSVRPTRRRVGGDPDVWTRGGREHARVVTSTGRKSCCLAGRRDPISLQKLAVLHVGPLVPSHYPRPHRRQATTSVVLPACLPIPCGHAGLGNSVRGVASLHACEHPLSTFRQSRQAGGSACLA